MHAHLRIGAQKPLLPSKSLRVSPVCSAAKASTVFIDLEAVVNTSPLHISCALAAAEQLPWGASEPDLSPSSVQASFLLSKFDIRDVPLSAPSDAVILVKLLQEELLLGPQQRASGTRRTRPFRAAEIRALWGEELLTVCLSRWALAAGTSTATLRQQAQQAWQASVAPAASDFLPASQPSAPAVAAVSYTAQQAGFDVSEALVRAQPVQQAVHVLSEAQRTHRVCLLSLWPEHVTTALLEHSNLGPAQPWTPAVSGSVSDPGPLQAPGLYRLQGSTWAEVLQTACDHHHSDMQGRGYVVTAHPSRAEQAADMAQSGQLGLPAPEVLLTDWGSRVPGLRARASAHSHLRLVDDVGLASVLGMTESRLVMDGIAW